jgi:hypothetical protein
MYKTRDWFILAPIDAIAFALAFWGFIRCIGAGCTREPAWKVLPRRM